MRDKNRFQTRRLLAEPLEQRQLLATFALGTTLDVLDGDTSSVANLLGSPGADGVVSLREAIIAANNTAGDDTINLLAGTYTLTLQGIDDEAAATGDLDVLPNGKLTIVGAALDGDGAPTSIVDASGLVDAGSGWGDRVFDVQPGSNADFQGIKITGAYADLYGGGIRSRGSELAITNCEISGNTVTVGGGGIYNSGWLSDAPAATVTITDSLISGNRATAADGRGGGIYNYAGDATSTVTITGSTITGNSAYADGGGIENWAYQGTANLSLTDSQITGNSSGYEDGGGLESYAERDGSTANVTLTRCTISGNTANDDGGGISHYALYGKANLTITDSDISGNTADGDTGGGIYNYSQYSGSAANVTITGSTIANNTADDDGGGIYNYAGYGNANLTITGSVISGNYSDGDGGGISNFANGNDSYATVTITSSTISDNAADGDGGGIYNYADNDDAHATVTITGSTISGNRTIDDEGGGIYSDQYDGYAELFIFNSTISGNYAACDGGGIYVEGGDATIINSTIAGNSTDGDGGGIIASGDVILQNTIVADNWGDGNPDDIDGDIDTANSYNNLIGDPNSAGLLTHGEDGNIVGDGSGNVLDIAAILKPLNHNGGPTKTHALVAGSAAIDAGSDAAALDADGVPLTTDQRGPLFPRFVGASMDIGAYEKGPVAPAVTTITVTTMLDIPDGNTASFADLLANPGPDGKISLREAIIATNNQTTNDTIHVPAGVYAFTDFGRLENVAADGDLDIVKTAGSLTIVGAKPIDPAVIGETKPDQTEYTWIDALGLDRVFQVVSGDVTFQNLVIAGGVATDDGYSDYSDSLGGGVLIGGQAGTVTFSHVAIGGNRACGADGVDATWSGGDGTGDFAHDQMGLSLEGIPVDPVSTAARTEVWQTYTVRVTDGQLTLALADLGGTDRYVALAGLVVSAVELDDMAPVATITLATTPGDPVTVSPVVFDVVFDEPVTAFTVADLFLNWSGPGTLNASVTGRGTTYQVVVSGMVGNGAMTLNLKSGAVHDLSGNLNDAAEGPMVTYQYVRQFDFGTTRSPVAANFQAVTEQTKYSKTRGYGWQLGLITSADRQTGSAQDRDLNLTSDGTFVVNVPNGTYAVTVHLGDLGTTTHDQMGVFLEGTQVDTVTTPGGTVVSPSYQVVVTDGQLTLRVKDLGGADKKVAITAVTVAAVMPVAAAPLAFARYAPAEVFAAGEAPADLAQDINGDGAITPLDVLQLINYLNQQTADTVPLAVLDVNADGAVTALDVLTVINILNAAANPVLAPPALLPIAAVGESEAVELGLDASDVGVVTEPDSGADLVSLPDQVTAVVTDFKALTDLEDVLADIAADVLSGWQLI